MLKMENSNVNFNGSSSIDEVVIAFMNASYNGEGSSVYFNLTVNEIEAYMANADAVNADFIQFKANVFETLNTMF